MGMGQAGWSRDQQQHQPMVVQPIVVQPTLFQPLAVAEAKGSCEKMIKHASAKGSRRPNAHHPPMLREKNGRGPGTLELP